MAQILENNLNIILIFTLFVQIFLKIDLKLFYGNLFISALTVALKNIYIEFT